MIRRRLKAKKFIVFYIICFVLLLFRFLPILKEDYQEIDQDEIYIKANLTNLHFSHHVSKLISNFPCHIGHVKILILVSSNVAYIGQRALIRRTWGKQSAVRPYNDFKLIFVCGVLDHEHDMQPIFREGMVNHDIVFGNFSDSESNRVYKIEAMLEYANKHCAFDYLLNVDEDVFINLSRLISLLHQPDIPQHRLYLGHVSELRRIIWHSEKVATGDYRYTNEEYLPSCDGRAVVFSSDVVEQMIPYFRRKAYLSADVYTAILAMNAGIQPINRNHFVSPDKDECVYDNEAVATQSHYHFKDNCLETMFFSMLMKNFKDPFITLHYIPVGPTLERIFTSPS